MNGNGRCDKFEFTEQPEHPSHLGEAIAIAKLSSGFYMLVAVVAIIVALPLTLGGPIVFGCLGAVLLPLCFLLMRYRLVRAVREDGVETYCLLGSRYYSWTEYDGAELWKRRVASLQTARFEDRTYLFFRRGKAITSTLWHKNAADLLSACETALKTGR